MLSKFLNTVMPILKAKKISLTSFQTRRLKDVESKLNKGVIDAPAAVGVLRQEFKYSLTDDDYRKIERELGYNVK